MSIDTVDKVVHISSNIGQPCPICNGSFMLDGTEFTEAVNHVLGHGWKLLHVGGEWGADQDGNSIQHTVAVLGRA